MKLGFITAICDGMNFEEVVDFAAENGLECLEVACWPQGGAQRRYAGGSHIDAANLTEEKAEEIKSYCREKGVEISSLAYYPNTLDPDLEKRQSYIAHIYKLIDASVLLDVNMITTFVGAHCQVCRGEEGKNRHRKLSDAVYRRRVAGGTEFDDNSCHLAKGF